MNHPASISSSMMPVNKRRVLFNEKRQVQQSSTCGHGFDKEEEERLLKLSLETIRETPR